MRITTHALFFSIVAMLSPGSAAVIPGGPCVEGSFAEYAALGDEGCIHTGYRTTHVVSGIKLSLNGAPLPPDLMIVPDFGRPIFRIGFNELLDQIGESYVFSAEVNVTGLLDWYTIGMDFVQTGSPVLLYTRNARVCLDGPVTASDCMGRFVEYDIVRVFLHSQPDPFQV